MHENFVPQSCVHVPQWRGSEERSVQTPSHVWDAAQVQAPAVQVDVEEKVARHQSPAAGC
jgi:hypothetical protein